MSVVITGKAPYEKIVTYQYVKDENGNEFHKSGGNNLESDVVADQVGADAIRYLYGGANITNDMRFGVTLANDAKRKMLGLWNIYTFFNTYACIDNPKLDIFKLNINNLTESDKWLIESVNNFVENSDLNYANHKSYLVVKDFEVLIDDVSNFYIRVNRKRFWKSDNYLDQMTAYYCLYHAIKSILGVMAPIIPFITDYIWQNLVREIEPNEAESVMLSNFPKRMLNVKFDDIISDVNNIRDIITIAQRLRNEKQIKIKQPLKKMFLIVSNDVKNSVIKLENIVKDELNIKEISFEKDNSKFNTEFLSVNFKTAGLALKGDVQKLKNELSNLNENEMINVVMVIKKEKWPLENLKI
jgi:isoleucyl-tRNA synthetase